MAGLTFLLMFLVGAAALFAFRWYFSSDQKAKRVLRAASTLSIRDAIDGQIVKVTGSVRCVSEPLIAPLSRRPCAAYRVEVEEYRRSGRSGSWHQIILDQDGREMELDDGTGRAVVNALGAQLVIQRDTNFSSGTFNDATPNLTSFLAGHGVESTGFFGLNKTMRYREGVLEEGELVTVLGLCRWENDPRPDRPDARGYRDVPRRLVMDTTSNGQLIISDHPDTLR